MRDGGDGPVQGRAVGVRGYDVARLAGADGAAWRDRRRKWAADRSPAGGAIRPACVGSWVTAMFGENGRIGVIVPANNAVLEPELGAYLPPGVALYATRILAKGDLTPEAVIAM